MSYFGVDFIYNIRVESETLGGIEKTAELICNHTKFKENALKIHNLIFHLQILQNYSDAL